MTEARRKWYENHRSEVLAQSKKWAEEHPEKVKESKKKYYKSHPEKWREYSKIYRKAHPEKRAELVKKWKEEHPQEVKEMNDKAREKRQSTLRGRLNHNVSAAVSRSLKGSKNGRCWEALVGYNLAEMKSHIEKQFLPGMTWANYGQWHIDHIIPVSAFNFEKPEHIDFKKCWNLKNIRPLWAKDNLKKSNKVKRSFQPSLLLSESS